jgi:hypothetical protein
VALSHVLLLLWQQLFLQVYYFGIKSIENS